MTEFNNNKDNNEPKSFISFSEFESFYHMSDSSPLAIVDATFRIIFSNSSFLKIFKFYHNQKFFELNSEPDLRNMLLILTNSSYNNMQFDLFYSPEHNLESSDFNVQAERIYIEEHEYFVLVFKSLKEKNKLEDRINNLHNALEYGNVPIIITNESGIITYSTTSFEKILKTGIEIIYNQSVVDALAFYLTNEDKKELQDAINKVEVWNKIISSTGTDGNTLYEELKLNPIFIEGKDTLNFILTANDITNYILKNLFIRKSERRLKSIINNISDLLFIFKNKDGQFLFENANENFCRIFSINKVTAVKKEIDSVLNPKFLNDIKSSIKQFDGNDKSFVEFKFVNSVNSQYSVKISIIKDDLEKEDIYVVGMHDITDQMLYQERLKKAYEKEISLNKMKTAFLENMSHEIRTPFNAIVGYSEIIDDCIKNQEYDAILELISSFKDVLSRVLNLFNNIVEVFQIYSGEVELDLVTLNCNQVLKSVYNKKLLEAEKKNLVFQLALDIEILNVKTDWIKLEKIVDSLVTNAIKYTDTGKIVINSGSEIDKVKITISDTGKGIEDIDIKRLFEPFVQSEDAYVRNYEGAGLGLTIAYQLTKLLNGDFEIQSEKNMGTKIILTFPIVEEFVADDL
ncbi:MAG TPA: ATP-binding protein [Ignavibacteriaceae bacterium]|nr:ATP-binding protein [Ignavibacteriaceae bacterium]